MRLASHSCGLLPISFFISNFIGVAFRACRFARLPLR